MGQQVFKNENFYIDETKSNYIEQLQTMYQKDIVVPEMKYKEFLEKLYEKFSLKETTLSGIDKVTYATLNSSVTTHLYLSNFFFITASFHDILKETAVITYGKTKKIYYQAQ